jgi:nonsense-mediated mRNA decay protein 3
MSSGRFCYLCGQVTEKLYEGMCRSCFQNEKKLVNLPEKLETELCDDCMRYYSGGWEVGKGDIESTLNEIARKEVEGNLSHNLENMNSRVNIFSTRLRGKVLKAELEVVVKGVYSGINQEVKLKTELDVRQVKCPDCSKRAGGYYEAVIQIRSKSLEKDLGQLHKILSRLYVRDKNAFIVEELKVKGGVDVKLGSSKAAKAIGAHFKTNFGAEIKESVTLMGRKEGKNIYRKTVLIRL